MLSGCPRVLTEDMQEAHRREGVTTMFDEVRADQQSSLDPVLARMQEVSLTTEYWD